MIRLQLLDSDVTLTGPPELVQSVGELFTSSGDQGGVPHEVRVDGLSVLLDGEPQHDAPDPARLLETVLAVVNATAIADCQSFAVHAGVVALDGVAAAWPGISGAGKSTLTAACLRAGFDYVSDEALALQDGAVRAYGKPLSLSAWSLAEVGLAGLQPGTSERAVPHGEVDARLAPSPLRLGHLVLLQRRHGPPTLEETGSAGPAMLLLEHSFNHYKDPERAFREATAAGTGARCWRLGYDAPGEAAALLRRALAQPAYD